MYHRIVAYLQSVFALKKANLQGIPLIPRGFFKAAPFNRRAYNSFIVEAVRWNLGDKPVIYDIGANHGDFALAFKRVYPGARLVLFEPLESLTAHLSQLNTRGSLEFEIRACALGGSDAEMSIEIPNNQNAASSLLGFGSEYLKHNPAASDTTKQNVRVRRLDSISELSSDGMIDLMKIDVEGFEFEVMRGAEDTLARVRNLVVEVSRMRHAEDEMDAIARMIDLMNSRGLKLHRLCPTIIDRNISPFPLEYDLYFSRF